MSDLMRSSSEEVSALHMSVRVREAGRAASAADGTRNAEHAEMRESRASSDMTCCLGVRVLAMISSAARVLYLYWHGRAASCSHQA